MYAIRLLPVTMFVLLLAFGASPCLALSSQQGVSVTGPNANVTDPDDQAPAFLRGPQNPTPFDNSHGYLSDNSQSSSFRDTQGNGGVLGPTLRQMQGGDRY